MRDNCRSSSKMAALTAMNKAWTSTRTWVLALTLAAVLPALSRSQLFQLGCFPLAKVQMLKGGAYRGNCLTVCSFKRQPLWASDFKTCYCGASIPDPAEMLDQGVCQQGMGDAVFVHYVHTNSSQSCTLSPLPFTWDNWQEVPSALTPQGTATLQFGAPGSKDTGVTLYSWDAYKYGAYSLSLQPSPELGAVAALYLISDRGIPPLTRPWDEIDFEFVNYAWEGKIKGPTMWSNTFVNGTRHSEGPIGKANPNITKGFHTYLIDWQPTYVRWYMDGNLVKEANTTQQPMPVKPLFTGVSFWQPNVTICKYFGGCGDLAQLHQAYAGQMKRIICQ